MKEEGEEMKTGQEEPQALVQFLENLNQPRTKIPIESHVGLKQLGIPLYSLCDLSLGELP